MDYILTLNDFIVGPLYFIVIMFITYRITLSMPKHEQLLKKYLLWMMFARLIGTLIIAFIYQFYYQYGDTFGYYVGAISYKNLLFEHPTDALNLFIETFGNSTGTTYLVMGILNLFCFDSYIGMSLLGTALNSIGWWLVFRLFYGLYPLLHKQLAVAFLFLPSILIYGAGVAKEMPSILGMNLFLIGVYRVFIVRQRLSGIFFIFFGGLLAYMIKAYLLICMLVACCVWIATRYKIPFRQASAKLLVRLAGFVVFLTLATIGVLQIVAKQERFQTENAITGAQVTQQAQIHATEEFDGSGYKIPALMPTPTGFTISFLAGVNVALFRPYIWEVRKVINIPMFLESLYAIWLTLYAFRKVGFFKTFRLLFTEPDALLCFTHAILLSAMAGIISFNYGTLMRYRVPCFSFYLVALFLVIDKANKRTKAEKINR